MRKFLIIIMALVGFVSSAMAARPVNIVFIGNSITFGATLENQAKSAATRAVESLEARGVGDLMFSNCGVCGATTVDFLPATATLFPKAVAAAENLEKTHGGQLVFQISLGTNDSACTGPLGSPVLPQQYYTNLKVIIDSLLETFPEASVVVQYPIWYSPTTYNGAMYLKAGLDRLCSYMPVLDKLGEAYSGKNVVTGSTAAYDFFKDKTELFTVEEGNAGLFYLHPNEDGAKKLGEFWADNLIKVLGRGK